MLGMRGTLPHFLMAELQVTQIPNGKEGGHQPNTCQHGVP